jgi:hypothetical protein
MADDYLQNLPVAQVADWYRRLAIAWGNNTPELQPALAGLFLRTWVDNRDRNATILFDAPSHLKSNRAVLDVQTFHRDVFLTTKKGRFARGVEKWAGIIPRLQGASGFTKWDMQGELALKYESLCDIAPDIWAIAKVQKFGSSADRDIFGSLRGFQLESKATVTADPQQGSLVNITFKSWLCSGSDRYDWNYSEYLTVVNPDFQSKLPNAVRPSDQKLTVYHRNAKRLEDAGQAAPYNVVLKPWMVSDTRVVGVATIDAGRTL